METVKLSQKHQIVVPKEIRKSLKLSSGSRVMLLPLDNRRALLVAQPAKSTAALKGLGKEVWQKLGGTQRYLAKERKSWK